ncbi:MAG TPA: IPT/TIG domain-containing protein, partial [Candidatus Wallbacteria bacterium]|nr:IPT/TIG domain-containing protein [Candidatus Wallbacteria bacterium]
TGSDALGPYVNANDSGNFEATFTIPARANGNYYVYARVGGGEGDESSNYTTYEITGSSIAPAITSVNHTDLSNNVSTGSLIRVSGSSFGANQPGIIIKFDGMGQNVTKTATFPNCEVASSLVKADQNGQFEVTFYAPDVPDGTHEVYAQVDNVLSNRVNFNVNNYRTPVISISDFVGIPDSGPKGTMLFVEGSGFVPDYTGITVKFNSVAMNVEDGLKYNEDWVFGGTITSDGGGNFQVKFPVPDNVADGTYEVKAFAGFGSSTEVQVYTVKSQNTSEIDVFDLNGDMHAGLAGSEVICRGVYFTPATGNIKLLFGTQELTVSDTTTYFNDYVFPPDYKVIKTDFDGKFEVKFNVPALENGNYTVTAFINDQTASNSVSYRIGSGSLTPALALTDSAAPYNQGPSNEVVRIDGTGFPANASDIKIYLGSEEMDLYLPSGYMGAASIVDNKKITADANGEFSVQFIVPMKTPMVYLLRASNGVTDSPTYSYTVQPISTFYTSGHSDFSTNDDAFNRSAAMYLKVISTELDRASITQAKFSIECAYHTGAGKHTVADLNLTN